MENEREGVTLKKQVSNLYNCPAYVSMSLSFYTRAYFYTLLTDILVCLEKWNKEEVISKLPPTTT